MIEKELTVDAVIDNVPTVTDFVNEQLEAADCPPKLQIQMDIAIDEVFSNIAFYAYAPGKGSATVRLRIDEAAVTLTFSDSGKPFDPLAKEDPDVTLDAQSRKIGGLGIFMVKKLASDVRYAFLDGRNVLTVVFAL